MNVLWTLLVIGLTAAEIADAGTLYRWTDASGTTRFGYQPPAGVEAEVAEEERREVYDQPVPIRCEDLASQHIALIDREVARIREMRTGLGPEFQLTPTTQQQLILDLLAHRAAMITGRPSSEFRSPSGDELLRSRNELQSQNAQLKAGLAGQEQVIDAQQAQLERARRKMRYVPPFMNPWYGPGFIEPWPGPYAHPRR